MQPHLFLSSHSIDTDKTDYNSLLHHVLPALKLTIMTNSSVDIFSNRKSVDSWPNVILSNADLVTLSLTQKNWKF